MGGRKGETMKKTPIEKIIDRQNADMKKYCGELLWSRRQHRYIDADEAKKEEKLQQKFSNDWS